MFHLVATEKMWERKREKKKKIIGFRRKFSKPLNSMACSLPFNVVKEVNIVFLNFYE